MKANSDYFPKRITRLLTALPDTTLLLLVKTSDQIYHWCLHRLTFMLVSEAWRARFTGKDDPLRQYVKSGELCRNDYERIWGLVECYERLWALVQYTEPCVKELFEQAKHPYPFGCAYELFASIVREQANREFSFCLTPYEECSAKKDEKQYRQLAHHINEGGLDKEPEKASNDGKIPRDKLRQLLWFSLLLAIADNKAAKNHNIKNALRRYWASVADLFELEASYSRRTGSFAWIDGEKVKGSKSGIYQKSP